MAVELRAWRERLDITQEKAAELLTNLWNERFPDNKKWFDDRTIRRWESGGVLFPLNFIKIKQIIYDKEILDALAVKARQDNKDVLDALAGERTPSSPPRMVAMRMEAMKDFYAEELAALQKQQRTTKKRRRKRKH